MLSGRDLGMQSTAQTSDNDDNASSSPSASKRRPRVNSTASATQSTPLSKRIRSDEPTPFLHNTTMAAATVASAKGLGKRPEMASGFAPMSGARRIVIKNFRASNTGDAEVESYYKRTWADVEEAVQSILAGARPRVPLERVYRGVEDLCRHGDAAKLYTMLDRQCSSHLAANVLPKIQAAGTSIDNSGDVLRAVRDQWAIFNKTLITIRSAFSYLDRSYLLNNKKILSVNDLLLSLYRKNVLQSDNKGGDMIWRSVVNSMCDLVIKERDGHELDEPALLHDAVHMCKVLGIYKHCFEDQFLELSEDTFQFFIDPKNPDELKRLIPACEELLKNEDHRCDRYNFESTTKVGLFDRARKYLIEYHAAVFLDKDGVVKLLEQNESDSLRGLHRLLGLAGLEKRLKEPFEDYIHLSGSAIVTDTGKGDDMVIRLLELRRKLDIIIRDSFRGDETFTHGLREAFSQFINDKKIATSWGTGTSKVGEMIAKHIDMLLRGGLKTLPRSLLSDSKDRSEAEKSGQASTADEDAELDRQLDQALELFRFIEGKDVFEAFYKKDLARRLLMGRSASQDAERNMLSKLKSECGSSFTHNLEQMFKDMELAKDEMAKYKDWLAGPGRDKGGVDLSVSILSQAAWPTYPEVKMLVPPDVAEKIDQFDAYYKNKHTGRKLQWKHNLAHCVLKATFPKGTKELLVSSLQAVVLVLFNQAPDGILSYEQISNATNLTGGELDRTLQSLACGKVRPLAKSPKGKEVNKTDTFQVNKMFTDPKYRIKINQIQLKETKAENKETHERVAADRQFETQAAIVRIMKSRKTMTHQQLVLEVIKQTMSRGAMDPADIKQNIEKYVSPPPPPGSPYRFIRSSSANNVPSVC